MELREELNLHAQEEHGRGQDFPNVKYVINYDMPIDHADNKGYSLNSLD